MSVDTNQILDVLHRRGIGPFDHEPTLEGESREPRREREGSDENPWDWAHIGRIQENEEVYTTSLDRILENDWPLEGEMAGHMREAIAEIDGRLSEVREGRGYGYAGWPLYERPDMEAVEPHCAWYCPIHFFGHSWGIYIREECLYKLSRLFIQGLDFHSLAAQSISGQDIWKQLLRSAFYVLFLHEQFHHKVESFGFRLLVASGQDKYRPYARNCPSPV